jgi:hypothetical protein
MLLLLKRASQLSTFDIPGEIRDGRLHEVQAEEQDAETEENVRFFPCLSLFGEQHRGGDADGCKGEDGDVHLEPQNGDDPAGERRADVGAEDHADGLDQGHQAGIDERDHHDGGRGRTLDQYGDEDTGEDGDETVLRHHLQNVFELVPCGLLKSFGEELHAIQEQAEATRHRQDRHQHQHTRYVSKKKNLL